MAILLAVLAACSDATGPGVRANPPAAMVVLAGAGQTATVATALPTALRVQVNDRAGRPVSGVNVAWAATSGGGSVATPTSRTDSAGVATTQWTLGTAAGAQTLEARVSDLPPVVFGAQARPGAAASIHAVSGGGTGTAGEPLAGALVAEVRDAYGNAVAGVAVSWRAANSNGTVTPEAAVTDGTGRVLAAWLLTTTAGTAEVLAVIDGSSAAPARFTATVVAGAPERVLVALDSVQFTALGDTARVSASAVDTYGNATAADVAWSSSQPTVIAVDGTGRLLALSNGTAVLTAMIGGRSSTINARVQQVATRVDVLPRQDTMNAIGATRALQATVRDRNGYAVAAPVTWSTLDANIATVDAAGRVRTTGTGTARIVGRANAVADTARILARQVLAQLTVSASTTSLMIGQSAQLTAVGRDSANSAMSAGAVTWESTAPSIVTVNGNGTLTALVTGSATITAISTATPTLRASVSISVAADPATTYSLDKFAGDNTTCPVSTTGCSFTVRVVNGLGQPMAGHNVVWTNGTQTVTTMTNLHGRATTANLTTRGTVGSAQQSARLQNGVQTTFNYQYVQPGGYNIDMRFIGVATPSQQAVFTAVKERWQQVITGDLPNASAQNIAAGACGVAHPAIAETIDDLLVYVEVVPIDGVGQVLGSAGPCYMRSSMLPSLGIVKLDAADVTAMETNGTLYDVVLHELGHVLGVGTMWGYFGLLQGSGSADPYFTGGRATSGFALTGGIVQSGVPVENSGGAGTRDGHWRESVFSTELMTGYINRVARNPLSVVTIASLLDMGYQVNFGAADPYTLPGAALRTSGPTANDVELIELPLPPPRIMR